jgi:hypothetical protein
MLNWTRVCGDVSHEIGLRDAFKRIRSEVKNTDVGTTLAELYQLTGFLIVLIDTPCWKLKAGAASFEFRIRVREEFQKTAREINDRAEQIEFELRFSEVWHLPSCRDPREHDMPTRLSAMAR